MRYRISANVIRRLPRYLRRLDLLEQSGADRTSSSELSRAMGLTASQIRQDFNCFGGFGQQGYGYRVADLRDAIAEVLGVEHPLRTVIIGAGNLGRALMANFRFAKWGFEVTAAFDTSERLIGTRISGIPVLDTAELESYLAGTPVDVAVLTLPQSCARRMAMVAASHGVRGLWNFTGLDIDADLGDTVVENVHLSDSLLTLGYYLRSRAAENAARKEEP